jgi:hypothetical protein
LPAKKITNCREGKVVLAGGPAIDSDGKVWARILVAAETGDEGRYTT